MLNAQSKFIVLAFLTLVLMYVNQPPMLIVDELAHASQIDTLVKGEDTHLPYITTFIFIHQIYAGLANLFDWSEALDYRLLNFLVSGLLILLVAFIVRTEDKTFDVIKATQLFFVPIALPYYPLIYTDIIALVSVFTAYYFFQKQNHWLSALFLTGAVLIRQPSLIWLGLFATMTFFNQLYSQTEKTNIKQWTKSLIVSLPYGLCILGFLIYFVVNKGIALGDKSAHDLSINLTNVYFMTLVFFMVFTPLLLSQLKAVVELLKQYKWLLLIIIGLLPVFVFTFSVTHKYNSIGAYFFIRNSLLNLIADNMYLLFIAYVLSAYTLLAIFTLKLKQKHWKWLFLFLPLSVITMPLIEQRYYMVGLVLWQLSRNRLSQTVESIQLAWMVLFSMYLFFGMSRLWFFL